MKTTTKQALITTGWFTILIAVIGGTMLWQRQLRHPKQVVSAVTVTSTKRIPTVLLLGKTASATNQRQLVAGLQQNNGSQSIVQVRVTRSGRLFFQGQFQSHDNRPYLQLTMPTGSTTQQAQWLKLVLQAAKQRLQFKHYNLVTFGDGGLTATTYLCQAPKTLIPLNLVAIATPFNGTSRQQNTDTTQAVRPKHQTTALKQAIAKRHTINPSVRITLIAGNAKGKKFGDGVVPIQSALAGQAIFNHQVTHYRQEVLHTWRASHTQLFSSWRLANLIQNALN